MNKSTAILAINAVIAVLMAFALGFYVHRSTFKVTTYYHDSLDDLTVTGEGAVDTPIEFASVYADISVQDPDNPAKAKIKSDEDVKQLKK